ncbi:glycosyltransferase [Clostridium botulinum]|uniref:glycosyltransferase n=1 Tax=Clostridium botulinum TaxID=1491 RepID=UPI001967E29C|nr:glycosyltransferase [Clostridium botulinum]MBN1075628.1 glycosyltransferase [Clostridium botulinum]
MIADKPLVSILLAVYKPNQNWLIEQLVSLNNQTYDNLELLIYDDCPEFPIDEWLFKNYITNFKYEIIRGKINRGSNKAFEELTKIGNGEYFAYCDQDDIWENNKIKILLEEIQKYDGTIAYSDMCIIDKNSNKVADSLKIARPRLNYIYGEKLYSKIFFSNCIAGCSMLAKRNIAQKAIPFSKVTIHDQWISIIGSFYGKIIFMDKPLVSYRIHDNNQTGILTDINTKVDYYNKRVIPLKTRLYDLKKYIKQVELNEVSNFCYARINKDIINIFKYRYLSKKEAYFEVIIKYIPNWLFRIIIEKLK